MKSSYAEPLLAEINIPSFKSAEIDSLMAQVSHQSTYLKEGVDWVPLLKDMNLTVRISSDDKPFIQVRSSAPVHELILNLLIEFTWSGGQIRKQFNIFLSPTTSKNASRDPRENMAFDSAGVIIADDIPGGKPFTETRTPVQNTVTKQPKKPVETITPVTEVAKTPVKPVVPETKIVDDSFEPEPPTVTEVAENTAEVPPIDEPESMPESMPEPIPEPVPATEETALAQAEEPIPPAVDPVIEEEVTPPVKALPPVEPQVASRPKASRIEELGDGEFRYGPVRPGESLSRIAEKFADYSDLDNSARMAVLYQLNPEAFSGRRYGSLMSGQRLRFSTKAVPDRTARRAPKQPEYQNNIASSRNIGKVAELKKDQERKRKELNDLLEQLEAVRNTISEYRTENSELQMKLKTLEKQAQNQAEQLGIAQPDR
ncbi:MAG: hypothetical protein OEZ43_13650 [Gammaproteobacteria bacterium]|nr:hypothetical protein [Gammaproteobacteria bacterium]